MASTTGDARFRLGLVVGKFAPLHAGHEWLVAQAAARCDRLLILSYSAPELDRCGVAARRRWLQARFPDHESIVIDDAALRTRCAARAVAARPLPDNGASDEAQQAFLAWLVADVLQRCPDAFFSSEHYGDATAARLAHALGREVHSVVVDRARQHVPVSATAIRADPFAAGHWLAADVRADFVERIAIVGGESSGKTTLALALAERHATQSVAEYGRELWERRRGDLDEADLLDIAHEQIRREDEGAGVAHRYLFCDTTPLTTVGYSVWSHARVAPPLQALGTRRYDGIVLCLPDFPFVQDGTRRDAAFRETQHAWYREQLAAASTPRLEVGGPLVQRVEAVAAWLAGPRPLR